MGIINPWKLAKNPPSHQNPILITDGRTIINGYYSLKFEEYEPQTYLVNPAGEITHWAEFNDFLQFLTSEQGVSNDYPEKN